MNILSTKHWFTGISFHKITAADNYLKFVTTSTLKSNLKCSCYSTFMHTEVDNEEGSTIRLYKNNYAIQNVWDYAYLAQCIAQKPHNGF